MLDRTILDGIRVAAPCTANWDEMVGDDRSRFCAGCGKDVYNIAGLTTEEAIGLVSTGGQAPCIRFYRRADHTVMTADCPVGATRVRRRLMRRLAGVSVVGLAMAASGLTALGFSRGRNSPPMPSGPGVTLDDWIDWGLISVGLRQPRPMVMMGGLCSPTIVPPAASGTPVMGEIDAVESIPAPVPPPAMIPGAPVVPLVGPIGPVPPPTPIQP